MIKVDEAIRIAKIIEYAPSDRLPLIAEVFTQAGVNINSLQAIAGSDVDDLLDKIEERFRAHKTESGLYQIPTSEFTEFCEARGIHPHRIRAELARAGVLQTSTCSGKIKYTVPVRKDGKSVRCIVLKMDETGG